MRGENGHPRRRLRPEPGSPPHARGKCGEQASPVSQEGITPACAGKITAATVWRLTRWDHPRMRGENCMMPDKRDVNMGSPPHARGKFFFPCVSNASTGITPACAGKMLITPPILRITGDHPRMRGENVLRVNGYMAGQGSPPHARGKFVRWQLVPLPPGITPACAGKMATWCNGKKGRRDHPRMRGENGIWKAAWRTGRGSPPHARGKSNRHKACQRLSGITPACAGKILRKH